MRKDIQTYSDSAYEMVSDISENIGSRLPGSKEEKKLAGVMSDKIKEIGLSPKTEKFIVAPRASIGGIPYLGWVGIVAAVMLYFEQLAFLSFAILMAGWIFLIVQVIFYTGFFDNMFHQEMSQNVYTELLPESGKYDYTIMLSAHTDTSWNWKHSVKNPKSMVIKMACGIISYLFVTAASLTIFVLNIMYIKGQMYYPLDIANYQNFLIAVKVLMPFSILGLYFITMWCAKNKSVASPGAMDNLTGISINYQILKYFKENPDKMPQNCRLIDMNCGSEEAGLKGSMAFCKTHKDDGTFNNLYAINVDSIADKDYFSAIVGDSWQFTKFDKGLEKMFVDSMKECGIEEPAVIKNPVGGCDSTPFLRAGARTITFAAQNPIVTNYYHTCNDVASRFDADTVNTGMDVILKVIDKIAEENK